ncbi:MAG: EAL domain-containing protein, partial [Azospira sp.]|nr:EAL domain-containing protein [Azospira sp.]
IPAAERSGGIARLGGWALRQTCAALQRLQRAGHPEVRLSVNVSPLQILRGQPFADDAQAAIEAHGIVPGRLELEISESVFLHDAEQAVKTLRALADCGVSLALDGIGRDYFSPAYLRRLPFRAMKIDRRCIGDAERDAYSDSIIRSSLLLAQGLGLEAIAEGVESEAQLAFLYQAGYRRAQGKLLGQPMPLDDLMARLQDGEH